MKNTSEETLQKNINSDEDNSPKRKSVNFKSFETRCSIIKRYSLNFDQTTLNLNKSISSV